MIRLLKLALISILLFTPAATADTFYTEGQITSAVVNGAPVDEISAADTSNPKTFFFSRINGCRGCVVTHSWFLDGELVYRYKATMRYDRTKWWTARPGNGLGTWEVRMTVDGQEVQVAQVDYQLATIAQQREVTVQKRVRSKSMTQCDERVMYFNELSEKNPDDPYYRFMARKWMKRCQ